MQMHLVAWDRNEEVATCIISNGRKKTLEGIPWRAQVNRWKKKDPVKFHAKIRYQLIEIR